MAVESQLRALGIFLLVSVCVYVYCVFKSGSTFFFSKTRSFVVVKLI